MQKSLKKVLNGYLNFREKYTHSDESIMQYLSFYGQSPEIMVVSCCDSRVDPALILQCAPGDLFVIRNVANIVPHYEKDEAHHGTSAALEFGIRFLNVKHLILLGHSQCGGIKALLKNDKEEKTDFINNWVSLVNIPNCDHLSTDDYAKLALKKSYQNCFTFPWIKEKVDNNELIIHLWFFDIKTCEILACPSIEDEFSPLDIA